MAELNKSELVRDAMRAGKKTAEEIQDWIKKTHKVEVDKQNIYNVVSNERKKAGISAVHKKPTAKLHQGKAPANSVEEVALVKAVIGKIGFERTKNIVKLLDEIRSMK